MSNHIKPLAEWLGLDFNLDGWMADAELVDAVAFSKLDVLILFAAYVKADLRNRGWYADYYHDVQLNESTLHFYDHADVRQTAHHVYDGAPSEAEAILAAATEVMEVEQ